MPDVAPRDFVSIQEIVRVEKVSIPQMVGGRGPRGLSIELRTTATDIEWRIAGASPEADWAVLTPLEAITGPQGDAGDEVALRATDTAIEWRLGEDGDWETLVVLEDLRGPRGFTGDAATLEVGTVVDSAPGSAPAVENVGDEHHAILNFTLPRGTDGDDGAAATLEVSDTVTLAPGADATVSNEGDETHAVLRFQIPRGDKGDPGDDGTGWTGASYDPGTGIVTFLSDDGLGFATDDLRGEDAPQYLTESRTLVDVNGYATMPFPAVGHLFDITFSAACRVRMYRTAAGRTADEGRLVTDLYPGGRDLVYEFVATGATVDDYAAVPINRDENETVLYVLVNDGPVTITAHVKET